MSSESVNKQKGITRRDFVKGGAVAAVGLAAGSLLTGCGSSASKSSAKTATKTSSSGNKWSWDTAPAPIPDSKIATTIKSDIVIVGAGIAGVTAACRASEKGATVSVVEKAEYPSSRGGHYGAYNTKAMKAAGMKPGDKYEMFREWVKRCGNRCNEKIVWEYLDRSGEAFDWLIDKSKGKLTFIPILNRYRGPYYYEYPGTHIIEGEFKDNKNQITPPVYFMWKKAEEQGAKFYFNSSAQQLVKDGDKVAGVIVKEGNKYKKYVATKSVVLATGDISGDDEMIKAYGGDLAQLPKSKMYIPAGKNTGDGHKMGMWAGAHMEMGPLPTMIHLIKYAWYCFGFLYVNTEGNRFMNEDTWIQAKSIRILNQPGKVDYAYSIFDSKYLDELKGQIDIAGGQFWDDMVRLKPWTPDTTRKTVEDSIKNGTGFKADSLEKLADLIGVNKTNFSNTVNNYNRMAKAGEDTEYHKRKELLTTIEKGPFYALKFGPGLLVIPGGLEINENFEVLDDDKKAITGLYAIGNVSGGRYGVDYPITFNGNSHGSAITEGYLVAEKIFG